MKLLAVAVFGLAAALAAQTPASGRTFDVVSVKVVDRPTDGFVVPNAMKDGRYAGSTIPVYLLVSLAFGVPANVPRAQLLPGIPDWANTTFVAIDARATGDVTDEQFHQMLRAMLVDRFGLKYHTEPREIDLRALRVAPGGAKLKAATAPCIQAAANAQLPAGQVRCGMSVVRGPVDPIDANGALPAEMTLQTTYTGYSVTMADFADYIGSRITHGPQIADETGMQGRYDLSLSYARTVHVISSSSQTAVTSAPTAPDDPAVTFADVLKAKLGLILVNTKGMRSVNVIDALNRPTGN